VFDILLKKTYDELTAAEKKQYAAMATDFLKNAVKMRLQETDVPWGFNHDHDDMAAWKTYRQALRDLSKTAEPKIDHETYTLINVTFPTRPDED
tara:strand:- start:142 stop:423 length:282 start_codon:yes stop_codon:yes gene_type:complete